MITKEDKKIGQKAWREMIQQWHADTFFSPKEVVESLASQVALLESKYKVLDTLAGEIIATLTLGDNQEWFEGMPEYWHNVVQSWVKRYESIGKDTAKVMGPSPLQEWFDGWKIRYL